MVTHRSQRLVLFVTAAACAGTQPSDQRPAAEPVVPAEITAERALPRCEGPVGSPGLLTDRAAALGVDFVHRESPLPDLGESWDGDSFAGMFGAGVVAADLDRDGHIDLFFANGGDANALYWGRGDGTVEPDTARAANASWPGEDTGFVSPADYDGDGDLDLLLGGWQTLRLLRNDGDRTFTDVSAEVGLPTYAAYPGATAWGDTDGDGDLDLFVGNYGEPQLGYHGAAPLRSWMLENRGGTFLDVTDTALPYVAGEEGLVLHARFQDLDGDGDLDLLQVNDFGRFQGNTKLWENLGEGTFRDRAPDSGIGMLPFPMGAALHDLDGDGALDLAFSDLARIHLFAGTGPWTWATADEAWGADVTEAQSDASWSVVEVDLDGDGAMGLYITYGPMDAEASPNDPGAPFAADQPDRLLVPAGDGEAFALREAPEAFAAPQVGRARGVAVADLNEDGAPDVIVSNIGQPPAVQLGACTNAGRAWVALEQPGSSNVHAIGAEVTVGTAARTQRRTVLAGGPGSGSGQEPVLHFGLGDADAIDAVEVRWPDGARSTVRPDCTRCRITIRRGPSRAR